jgi:hypothetical protein
MRFYGANNTVTGWTRSWFGFCGSHNSGSEGYESARINGPTDGGDGSLGSMSMSEVMRAAILTAQFPSTEVFQCRSRSPGGLQNRRSYPN